MTSRYEVTLGGKKLSAINKNLLILDVGDGDGGYTRQTNAPAGGERYIAGEAKRDPPSIVVTFELHIYGTAARRAALQKVISWAAAGGVMTINDREDQQITVVCDEYPTIESVRDWTSPLSIVFRAYGNPYWENEKETLLTLSGSSANGKMAIPGNISRCRVDVEVKAAAAITSLTVTVDGNAITLSGISCPKNGIISFTHDENGILAITQDGASILEKRTAASADDLTARSGRSVTMKIKASAKVKATYKARGCWL